MIDFLSNPDWIRPQMDFLIYLQNIRINCSDIFDRIFLSITIVGEFWLPTLICAIVYWCIDFKAGVYLFSLEGFNKLFTYLFKMLACVYRPWILDSRIHPSQLAIPYATGYSFPSGHSAMSSAVLGGCAYLLKHKIWSIILICLVLLVGFSRLWLGVHTPQDVVIGLLTGFSLVFILYPLIDWAEKDRNRYVLLTVIVDILTVIALIYIYFYNTYRMDYVAGKLLVNPQALKDDALITFGYSLGFINGCFLCAKFSPFNPKETPLKQLIIRGVIGSILVIVLVKYAFKYVLLGGLQVYYAASLAFLIGVVITLVYPIIFIKLEKLIFTYCRRKNE